MSEDMGHNGLKAPHGNKGADGQWKRQVRINLSEAFAAKARQDINDPALAPLKSILDKYGMALKNQFDAFAGFCAEAEASGQTDTVLYRWTKDLVDNPAKKEQYATRFTLYAGGVEQIYEAATADALAADLAPLQSSGMITKISNISADPQRNPQAPARFER